MPVPIRRFVVRTLATLPVLVLAACSSFNDASLRLADVIQPYRVEIVQGNFVSREQVQALSPGLGRAQVREILGTPLLTSVFHAERWDYAFAIKRPGVPVQSRRLTVFFKNDVLERFEGDEMPTEAEFVATLDAKRGSSKVPVLQATEESLKTAPKAAAVGAAPGADAPLPNYPPLEAPLRVLP